ncbi:hypothetical protein SGPA1_22017 [Streptomyces misionensis JCM 4497]
MRKAHGTDHARQRIRHPRLGVLRARRHAAPRLLPGKLAGSLGGRRPLAGPALPGLRDQRRQFGDPDLAAAQPGQDHPRRHRCG